ncbi:MAG: VacJ family lipoprotein [Candidatus Magnetomorum sp.]|nr:VacJ family lipoprotein [Candidatus Magnetomorum sp.]
MIQSCLKKIIKFLYLCSVCLILFIAFEDDCIFASDGMTTTPEQIDVTDAQSTDDLNEDWEDEFDNKILEGPSVSVWDPLEKVNRGSFYFNDKLYFWCLKPIAKTYKRCTPSFIRMGLLNFFNNLEMPQRAVNCMLQLRPKETGIEMFSFIVNTSIGILGFTKPSEKIFHLDVYSEDMGQTFGRYGIGNGIYIVLPVMGSSSLRDLTGAVGDMFLDPVNYIRDPYISTGVSGLRTINASSFRLGEYEALKEAAFEPYSAMKDAYIQYRTKQIAQ